jgi:hypothetical protein
MRRHIPRARAGGLPPECPPAGIPTPDSIKAERMTCSLCAEVSDGLGSDACKTDPLAASCQRWRMPRSNSSVAAAAAAARSGSRFRTENASPSMRRRNRACPSFAESATPASPNSSAACTLRRTCIGPRPSEKPAAQRAFSFEAVGVELYAPGRAMDSARVVQHREIVREEPPAVVVDQLEHQRRLPDSAPGCKGDGVAAAGDHTCVEPGLAERQLAELDHWDQGAVDSVFRHSGDSREIVDVSETVVEIPNRRARLLLGSDSDDRRILCAKPDADEPTINHEPGVTHDVLLEMNAPKRAQGRHRAPRGGDRARPRSRSGGGTTRSRDSRPSELRPPERRLGVRFSICPVRP